MRERQNVRRAAAGRATVPRAAACFPRLRCALGLVVGVLVPGAGALALPTIQTQLVVESASLEPLVTPSVRAAVALWMSEQARARFPFVRWSETADPDTAASHSWRVVLLERNEERDFGGVLVPLEKISLRHDVVLAGSVRELGDAHLLYDFGDLKPSAPDALEEAILEKLEEKCTQECFTHLFELFLREVALADRVLLDGTAKRFALPLRDEEISVSPESLLELRFGSPGSILRVRAAERLEGFQSCDRCIRGEITLSRGLSPPPQLPIDWIDDLPRLASSRVGVFMYDYRKSLFGLVGLGSDGLAEDP
jgi:hypothetical protein